MIEKKEMEPRLKTAWNDVQRLEKEISKLTSEIKASDLTFLASKAKGIIESAEKLGVEIKIEDFIPANFTDASKTAFTAAVKA